MRTRIRRSLMTAAAAIAMTFASSASARADLALTLSETGHAPAISTVPSNTGPAVFGGTLGDFTITVSVGQSNSPGTSGLAFGQQGTITIVNNDTTTAHTLTITVSAQGFTSPTSPPPTNLTDTVSGSLVSGSVSGNFRGYADTSNTLYTTTTPGGAGVTAAQLLTFTDSTSGTSYHADGTGVPFSPNGATYSLTAIANFTLGAGASITLTGGNVETHPTPEPMTLASAGIGIALLVGRAWLRRRK